MKTIFKQIALLALAIGLFTYCSTDILEEANLADSVTERIDIKITGDQDHFFYTQSIESDASIDLVSYDYYGNPSDVFGFEIRLEANRVLKVTIHNDGVTNPWEEVGMAYAVSTNQNQINKERYAIFEMIDSNGESQSFSSANNDNTSSSIINAFVIQEFNYNSKEILCRINNVNLFGIENSNGEIIVNGTFRGAVTFE